MLVIKPHFGIVIGYTTTTEQGEDGMAAITVTETDFVSYVRFRMLECVGNAGDYRRYVNARKEQRVEWAVNMHASVQGVQVALWTHSGQSAARRRTDPQLAGGREGPRGARGGAAGLPRAAHAAPRLAVRRRQLAPPHGKNSYSAADKDAN